MLSTDTPYGWGLSDARARMEALAADKPAGLANLALGIEVSSMKLRRVPRRKKSPRFEGRAERSHLSRLLSNRLYEA